MKKIKKWFLLLTIPYILFSCGEREIDSTTKTTCYYIFLDITDSTNQEVLTKSQINKICENTGWKEGGNNKNGIIVKFFPINDLGLTKEISPLEIKRDDASWVNAQPALARQTDIETFKNETFVNTVEKIKKELVFGKEKSKIFENLCKRAKSINEEDAENKVLLIYSDMLENSDNITFYSKKLPTLNDFDKSAKSCDFPDLTGIKISIISPVQKENDKMVNIAWQIWESFFASKNAKSVNFDVDLNFK
jgi:hypothetical protein